LFAGGLFLIARNNTGFQGPSFYSGPSGIYSHQRIEMGITENGSAVQQQGKRRTLRYGYHGSPEEYRQSMQLLKEAGLDKKVLGRVVINDEDSKSIGNLKEIKKLSTYCSVP
jgi:hypothetical protein